MEELGLVPEIFEETATLFETAEKRLFELANTVRLSQNAVSSLNAFENSAQQVISPVNQHSPISFSQSAPQNSLFATTSPTETARFLPPSYHRTLPYSNTPEPVESDSLPVLFRCTLAIAVVAAATFAWWRYFM